MRPEATNDATGVRIGADIGGTFTDLMLVDDDGLVHIEKRLTTPRRPDDAVVGGVEALLARHGSVGAAVRAMLHATTLFTNALIERRGAVTGLVATQGFGDAIEIAREHRFDMYDLRMRRPEPLAPRERRFEVTERVLADGTVHTVLDPASLDAAIDGLRAAGVEAVAVCLLHSYANDTHERAVGARLAEALPDVAVGLSCDLVPEIREYERTSTTLANVYIQPIAARYLSSMNGRLAERGVPPVFVMQSDGGLCAPATAVKVPIRLVESGPAAGALAAAAHAERLGMPDLVSFDMGGTTAKACMVVDGAPLTAPQFEVDRRYRFLPGSGMPVRVPVIEMIEIGTGGGSIAAVDDLGRLTVGPHSAGSEPGPACYGLGGTRPTVTDADLVLGYLDPGNFLGGTMALDPAAARRAIEEGLASLGLDAAEGAAGIRAMADEAMAQATRIHAIERGCDVGKFALFAFGGAGPVHAYGVAERLGITTLVYPGAAGVMSAFGLLTAPIAYEAARSDTAPLGDLDLARAETLLGEVSALAQAEIEGAAETITIQRAVYLRYVRQSSEVRVSIPDGPLTGETVATLAQRFAEAYRALYGRVADAPIETVSWRAVASGPRPPMPFVRPCAVSSADALKGHRPIFVDGAFVEAPVYDRYALSPGAILPGPAVVEERESTVVLAGPCEARVGEHGELSVSR